MLRIAVDKKGDTPVYRQIIEQITMLIRDGELSPGGRLPPERELADRLKVARGTVKKAYEKLASNNVIEMTRGRGTFISRGQDLPNQDRKSRAVNLMGRMIDELERLKFSPREMGNLFQILLMEHEEKREAIHIAGIDCNPESLSIFDRQLRYISNLRLHRFLLDDLRRSRDARRKLAEFSLILTTSTHYAEVCGMLPGMRENIVRAAVSPSQQTIIDLAKIPPSSAIGIVSRSRNFLNIIRNKISEFQIAPREMLSMFEDEPDSFPAFTEKIDVLITPPVCSLESRKDLQPYFQRFSESGGTTIRFDYQMERGALMDIEERISRLAGRRIED